MVSCVPIDNEVPMVTSGVYISIGGAVTPWNFQFQDVNRKKNLNNDLV
jgi:hypothetical protein